jgi:hypothetical protein
LGWLIELFLLVLATGTTFSLSAGAKAGLETGGGYHI